MKKERAIPILNDLNKVISGSQKIKQALETNSDNVNMIRVTRACMLNNELLAKNLKLIVTHLVEQSAGPLDFDNIFNDIFKGK